MKKQLLTVFVTLVVLLVGCKKDKNDTETPDNPTTAKVLKRIIETENGVTTTNTLSYGGNKRLIAITSNDGEQFVKFTYDDNGNITKIENKADDVKNIFEFSYNNSLPVSGNFKSYEVTGSEEVLTNTYDLQYTVVNGMVTKIKAIIPANPSNGQQASNVEYDLAYSNGNLTRIASGGIAAYSAAFTYGSKKPVFPVVSKYILDPAGFSAQFYAKNEILTIAYDFPGNTLDNTITTAYTYDAQGYVLTANDGETQSRFEYE
jgi:YD repeat-containing protein